MSQYHGGRLFKYALTSLRPAGRIRGSAGNPPPINGLQKQNFLWRYDRGVDAEASPQRIKLADWIVSLMARRPESVAAVALANKMARTIWARLVRGAHTKRRRRHNRGGNPLNGTPEVVHSNQATSLVSGDGWHQRSWLTGF